MSWDDNHQAWASMNFDLQDNEVINIDSQESQWSSLRGIRWLTMNCCVTFSDSQKYPWVCFSHVGKAISYWYQSVFSISQKHGCKRSVLSSTPCVAAGDELMSCFHCRKTTWWRWVFLNGRPWIKNLLSFLISIGFRSPFMVCSAWIDSIL